MNVIEVPAGQVVDIDGNVVGDASAVMVFGEEKANGDSN